MLDRFNFYDVYGYVIPGLALIGLLLMPGAIVKDTVPSTDIGAALASLVLAYILGHLLHRLSQPVFVHKTLAHDWLDPNDKNLSTWAKQTVRDLIKTRFNLDLSSPGTDADDKLRREAFHLCRAAAVQDKAARYLEQWQSLYVAMRHLASAFILGAASCLGWLVRVIDDRMKLSASWALLLGAALVGEVLVLLFVMGLPHKAPDSKKDGKPPDSKLTFGFACIGLTVFGFLQADPFMAQTRAIVLLSSALVGLVLTHKLLIRGYRTHSDSYAREVFMSFLALATDVRPQSKSD